MMWTTLVTDNRTLLEEEWCKQYNKRLLSLSEAFPKLLYHTISCKEILILAKEQKTLDLANRLHIPAVGLEIKEGVLFTGTPYILQGLGEESMAFLERVYRRYYDMPVVRIETQRLFIREMQKSDTDNLFRLYHCEDVKQQVAQADFGYEELCDFIESYRNIRYPLYDYGMWVLEEKDTGEFVGEAGIEEDSYGEGEEISLEAGYVVAPKYRRRGYGAEALQGILAFVREQSEDYGWKQISCYIHKNNTASIRMAKKCGFQYQTGGYGKERDLDQYSFML